MQINRDYERVTEAPARSSVWDKWLVAGMTRIPVEMDKADIKVQMTGDTRDAITAWAMRHEEGHVGVAEDVVDGCGGNRTEAAEVFTDYDRWQNEVEAWTRSTFELHRKSSAEFILDCLNSYRRGLNVSDEEWNEGVEVIAGMAPKEELREYIRNYIPIEPYDDQPPPSCGEGPGFDPPESEGDGDDDDGSDDGDGDDSDDDSDSDSDEEDDGETKEERIRGRWDVKNPKTKATLDERWNDSALIDELASGRISLTEAAQKLGVKASTATPLAQAVAIRQ